MIPSLNYATQSGVSGATTSGATSGGGGAVATFPTMDPGTVKIALIAAAGLLALVVVFKLASKK